MARGRLLKVLGSKFGNKYMIEISRVIVVVADLESDRTLWHQRLGHVSKRGMKVLSLKGKLYDLKSTDIGLCEDGVLSMRKRVSSSKIGREPMKENLELVHTNVWELACVHSLGGSSYYIMFIDDSTGEVWVYFLNNISDAFATFRRWKVEVEKEIGLTIKCLRQWWLL